MHGTDWNGNGRVDAGDWYIDYEIMHRDDDDDFDKPPKKGGSGGGNDGCGCLLLLICGVIILSLF